MEKVINIILVGLLIILMYMTIELWIMRIVYYLQNRRSD